MICDRKLCNEVKATRYIHVQNISFKLYSFPKTAWIVSLTYRTPYFHVEACRHHSLLHPLATLSQRTRGGYVILPHAQNFISTSDTLVQVGMWCYLEFVFSGVINNTITLSLVLAQFNARPCTDPFLKATQPLWYDKTKKIFHTYKLLNHVKVF